MEDANLVSGQHDDRRIRATVELREALGSDVVVHFTIHATPALTDDVKELAIDIGDPIVDGDTPGSHTNVVARLNPRTRARKGEPIELVVDTSRLHFFDLEDSAAIYGKTSSHLDT
jgi:multiple sugar transport system ATP-binding protein